MNTRSNVVYLVNTLSAAIFLVISSPILTDVIWTKHFKLHSHHCIDGLENLGARTSAGAVMTEFGPLNAWWKLQVVRKLRNILQKDCLTYANRRIWNMSTWLLYSYFQQESFTRWGVTTFRSSVAQHKMCPRHVLQKQTSVITLYQSRVAPGTAWQWHLPRWDEGNRDCTRIHKER